MNNNKQIAQEVIGDKKTNSREFHKRNLSRKLSKPRRLLCIDDISEVLGGSSSYWVSPISSTPVLSDKKLRKFKKRQAAVNE